VPLAVVLLVFIIGVITWDAQRSGSLPYLIRIKKHRKRFTVTVAAVISEPRPVLTASAQRVANPTR